MESTFDQDFEQHWTDQNRSSIEGLSRTMSSASLVPPSANSACVPNAVSYAASVKIPRKLDFQADRSVSLWFVKVKKSLTFVERILCKHKEIQGNLIVIINPNQNRNVSELKYFVLENWKRISSKYKFGG